MNTSFKMGALAASIALAMASTAAMAATTAPAATQLPGKGAVTGTVTAGTATNGEQTLSISGNAVINWGAGSDINASGTGGFDIGSGAKLHFAGQTASGTDAVLNIDSSGNASQIFGTLDAAGSLGTTDIFVANSNGVIVGAGATVNGNVSLIANKLSTGAAAAFNGTLASLTYNGTGGDVTVQKGATLEGTIFVSGGGNVNVDLGAIQGASVSLNAGLSSSNAGSFATSNTAATLNVTGAIGGGSLTGFSSAGTASNAGELNISGLSGSAYSVGGTFTNTGILTLPGTNGAVHNQGQLTTTGNTTFNGTLTNDGTYTVNSTIFFPPPPIGPFSVSGMIGFGMPGSITVNGGDFVNNGTVTGAQGITVTDGGITNKGTLTGTGYLSTYSDANYTAGADYSITNSGTITSSGSLGVYANVGEGRSTDAANDTTGSFINTGVLDGLSEAQAYSDVNLGGKVTVAGKALSATNELGSVYLDAVNGTLTIATPLFAGNYFTLGGQQVKIMSDLTLDPSAYEGINIQAGDQMSNDFAVRIASGVTLTAPDVSIYGSSDAHPNVILQGTIAADSTFFNVSDLFTGASGGIVATGDNPMVQIDFTGRVKSAPYLNDATNFRYNGLPITVSGTSPLTLYLVPEAYQTNGTSNGLSAVNLLVNGSVNLAQYDGEESVPAPVLAGASAVTGVTNIPNTHLVLQSTGNIQVNAGLNSSGFYWPGYVYLGNIAANADGSAAPGTLGYGTITLTTDFNNVLPGDTSGAGGVHFITQYPLVMNGHSVTTNAHSWVNFGTDQLTAAYAAGVQGAGLFFGGVQGSGNVVNYGDLDPSLFHTQAPSSTK